MIALSLAFAFRYHSKLIEVVKRAVGPSTPIAISNDNVLAQSAGPALTGPTEGVVGSKLAFSVERPLDGVTISWVAEKGDPSSDTGTSFATSYAKAGSYEVTATYLDGNDSTTLKQKVVITATAPATTPAITLPFLIKNWARLVIVIFGVGVIAALMAIRVLDAAAGVGILGALLGVGAVTATSSGGNESGATPPTTSGSATTPTPPAEK